MAITKSHYYFESMRKYIVAFHQLLSGYKVIRVDENGSVIKEIPVQVTYAGKDKIFYMLQRNENTRPVNQILPRIGFIVTSMVYDASRRINPLNQVDVRNFDGESVSFNYSGAPYNITIIASILAKNMDDMLQIVEQIVPKFTPDYNMSIKEIPEYDIFRDISVNLESVDFSIESEYGEEENRIVAADLTFTLKGLFYRSITDTKIIEKILIHKKNLQGEDQKIVTIQDIEGE